MNRLEKRQKCAEENGLVEKNGIVDVFKSCMTVNMMRKGSMDLCDKDYLANIGLLKTYLEDWDTLHEDDFDYAVRRLIRITLEGVKQ